MEPYPSQPTPVGGIYFPVNKLEFLAPHINLTILSAVAVVTVAYVKKKKKRYRLTLEQTTKNQLNASP